MKKYRVIALNITGKGKNIFKRGDEVTEARFAPGVADAYVKSGHMELIGENDEKVAHEPTEDDLLPEMKQRRDDEGSQAGSQSETKKDDEEEEEGEEGDYSNDPLFKRTTRNAMIKDLQEAGVEFEATASKGNIFALWSQLKKQQERNAVPGQAAGPVQE